MQKPLEFNGGAAHVNYPLRVIHHYTLTRAKAEDFLDVIAGLSRESLERIGPVPRKRAEILPLAALVLQRVLQRVRPDRLVFTALGLREGCLFDVLPAAKRRLDPLLDGCEEMARANARFAPDAHRLYDWTAPLFRKPSAEFERLHRAACLLGDIAWSEHPDYRAEVAFERVLRMPMVGIHAQFRLVVGTPEPKRHKPRVQQAGVVGVLDVLLHQFPVTGNALTVIAKNS